VNSIIVLMIFLKLNIEVVISAKRLLFIES